MAIDLGGTKLAAALVDEQAGLSEPIREPTRGDTTESILDQIGVLVDRLVSSAGHRDFAGIVLGVPGLVDFENGVLIETPNLPMVRVPLQRIVEDRAGLPVLLENDANLATLGEHRFGAGKQYSNFILLTIGTGIGGGIILNDELYRGAKGTAAEIGHMIMDIDGPQGPCGHHGCFETLASGGAIGRRAQRVITKESRILELAGGDQGKITGEHVTKAARDGDALAIEVLEYIGGIIGTAFVNVARIFDPEAIVVGGGVAEAGDLVLEPARLVMKNERLPPHAGDIPVVPAELGQRAPFLGSAALAFEKVGL